MPVDSEEEDPESDANERSGDCDTEKVGTLALLAHLYIEEVCVSRQTVIPCIMGIPSFLGNLKVPHYFLSLSLNR